MKKAAGIFMFLVVIGLAGWMIRLTYMKIKLKNSIETKLKNLPEFSLLNTADSIIGVNQAVIDKPLIIIYFNSECGQCDHEAVQIRKYHQKFKGIKILFVSVEPSEKIFEFDKKHSLSVLSGIDVGKIEDSIAFDVLGITVTPQIFIYSRDGILMKKYKGSVKAETLLKHSDM